MSDIETLREELEAFKLAGDDPVLNAEAHAALARLEEELKRLSENATAVDFYNDVLRLSTENAQLRAEQDNAGFIPWRLAQDALDQYASENAHLREELKKKAEQSS